MITRKDYDEDYPRKKFSTRTTFSFGKDDDGNWLEDQFEDDDVPEIEESEDEE